MIQQLFAKKSTGLGDLFREYVPQQLEEKSVVKVEHSAIVRDVFKLYLTYLQDESCYSRSTLYGPVKFITGEEIYGRVNPVDPHQLTALLETMKSCIGFDRHKDLFPVFVDSLIQKSYDVGYNDFTLDSSQIPNYQDSPVIFCDLKGKEEKPLHITIRTKKQNIFFGNGTEIGLVFGRRVPGTEHCLFEMHGNLISDDGGLPYGDSAKYCTYVHYGLLRVKESEGMDDFKPPEDCVFKTSNKKTVRLLQKILYSPAKTPVNTNQIYFIDSEGKEHLQ